MRLAYIAPATIPSRSAYSVHVMKMCQALARCGHTVKLLVPKTSQDIGIEFKDIYEFYGVDRIFDTVNINLPSFKGSNMIFASKVCLALKKMRAEGILSRHLHGAFCSSLLHLPTLYETHNSILNEKLFNRWLYFCLIRQRCFRKLIVISDALRLHYLALYPQLNGKIAVLPDAADPVGENVQPIIIDGSDGRLQVGYIGHLYAGRGIELIKQIAHQCPWADFHIVGGTDDALKKYMDIDGATLNIRFHGFVTPKEVERYRISFDILIAPYQSSVAVSGGGNTAAWMSPLKIFEYMSAGKAIICSDLPVLREVLRHNENAILCPPNDVNCWTQALTSLNRNKILREQLGLTAQKDFLANLTWEKRAKSISTLLRM